MKHLKKIALTLALASMMNSPSLLRAQEYVPQDCMPSDDCCMPYECSRNACTTPYVALGAIALVAIVAVACSSGGGHHHHHHHGHGHCE